MRILFCSLVCFIFLQIVLGSIESDCTLKHNLYREKHGAPALRYSQKRTEEAQKAKGLQHVLDNGNHEQDLVIFSRYNEGNSYNYQQPETSISNNRLIEILWKSQQSIGCGLAIDETGVNVRTAVVAIYEPAGIRVDIHDYIENILPPK